MNQEKYDILKLGDTTYKTTFTDKFKNRKTWKKPMYNRVKSQLPGTISDILVEEGQTVAKGDKLFVYEAMKMRNVILAQTNGIIKKINVTVGQTVGKDYTLAEITL